MNERFPLLEKWVRKVKTLQRQTQLLLLLLLGAAIIVTVGLFQSPSTSEQSDSIPGLFVNIGLKLGVVILLIYITAFIINKLGIGSLTPTKQRQLQILETLPLSSKRSLYLIKAGKQSLLIGATDQSVTLIAELEPELPGEPIDLIPSAVDFLDRQPGIHQKSDGNNKHRQPNAKKPEINL